ncbi:hypothetical protein ACFQ0X_27670 [Streptomyces rectiviolaceus]|uniref:Uncharacterized protein n=1 Tax=Streptomyces rectiviolaceus TaxID=332591 RepID=A0ABP6MD61_9ACTN
MTTATAATAATGLADAVEERLGDPYDEVNPLGFRAVLAASEAGRPLPEGAALLADTGLTVAHHGSEELLHALRALCRRTPLLAADCPVAGENAGAVRVGAATGALDSALRITVRHLRARHLYGAAAIDISYLRSLLAGAYADLLLCDVLTTLAVRGGDTLPARAIGPRVLQGAMDRLSVVMGSRFYIREGEQAVFQVLLAQAQRVLFAPGTDSGPLAGTVDLDALLATPAVADLTDPELLDAAPGRTLTAPTRRVTQPSGPVEERLYAELTDRYDTSRSFGTTVRPLPDRP